MVIFTMSRPAHDVSFLCTSTAAKLYDYTCSILQGERRAGFVGVPLPGVEVKVIPQATSDSDDSSTGTNGNDKPAPGSTSDSECTPHCWAHKTPTTASLGTLEGLGSEVDI